MTRKTKVRLWILAAFLSFLLVLAGIGWLFLWFFLAQPSLRRSPPSEFVVSSEKLERHVRLLSEEFAPRSAYHLRNMNRTAEYIKAELDSLGVGEVCDQWYEVDRRRYRNVSLLIGDPNRKRLIVGAHYDAFGPFPAADDNASGVAGVIELARLVAQNPLEIPVEFVAYPLEEPPYFRTDAMGSWQHASAMKETGRDLCLLMISLEMIGYFSDEKGSQDYPIPVLRSIYPSRGNFITVVGNLENRELVRRIKFGMRGSTDLPVRSISGPASIPGIDFSDHRNYWRAGFPAVMITDTAFYRNKAYHTAEDTADRLDYEKMAMVVVGVYEAIRRL